MPSKHTSATKPPDRPMYPEYEDRFGRDPARFLCSDMNPQPMIRGIESVEYARAWLDVETDRETPRKRVIAALNKRLSALEDGQ